jgi:hypothetical protein
MVNARPALTFNGASAEPGAAGKKSKRPERRGESFAAYFKAEQPAAKPQTAQTLPDAVASAYKAAQAAAANQVRPEPATGSRPEGLPVKNAPLPGKPALYAAHASPGARTAVAERPARAQGAVSALPRRPVSAPRIAGRPVTGRNGIGMTDTRKLREDDDASGPGGSAVRRQKDGMFAAHAPVAGQDAYSRFGRHTGDIAGYSFLRAGFASKSAEAALKKLGYDVKRAEKIETRATLTENARTRGINADGFYPEAEAARAAENGRSVFASGREARRSALPTLPVASRNDVGALAAKFESGEEGIAAIGYDGKGGTSYGKFQISSRVGTMRAFLSYLRASAPDLAARLAECGPANTGSRAGAMPEEWRRIAAEQPERFDRLQSDFIRTSHFEPAVAAITDVTGISFEKLPPVLREVVFSTAVQHGPGGAAGIVSRAMAEVNAAKLQAGGASGTSASRVEGRRLITNIYTLRAGRFASSSPGTREAVFNRLKAEMREALDMLA